MKEKELKELKLTKNIIIPFPNFQPNTIISPTQINDNFEEIEYAYNNLIDLHNGAISKVEDSLNRSDEAIDRVQGVENDLQDSERKRILNENTRITNESARISSENIRIENENTRNSKENTRIANETQREQQELERMSTYQTHINDEIKREEKHNQMINSFNEKVTEVDEAIASIPTKEELKGEKGDKGDRGEQGVKGDTPSITHLETSINNKIQEVETRFATLTSSRQQDAEVIDARDGETSLKARLDRDIEKAKQVYIELEGSYISTESSTSAIQDLEILGNTVQDLSNLADIKSVGVLQEDGTYKMSILSCGKNLIPSNSEFIVGNLIKGNKDKARGHLNKSIKVKKNTDYFITVPSGYLTVVSAVGEDNISILDLSSGYLGNHRFNTRDYDLISFQIKNGTNTEIDFTHLNSQLFQLEEGTVATEYEPYQGNKCDILLPCQLEKVGDVSDRLYYDEKEKAWCIEKWQKDFTDLDALNFVIRSGSDGVFKYVSFTKLDYIDIPNKLTFNNQLNNKYSVKNPYDRQQNSLWLLNNSNNKELRFSLDGVETNISIYKEALKGVFIKYTTSTPQKIILPLSTQIALNSFFGTTHVYMESGEVEGTIKCKVPKSLGATVQSLNNKTDILSDRIEAIEGLKDSQNMKYETDKGYLVCKETKNGVIDDLKIEGKTLVNLSTLRSKTLNNATGEGRRIDFNSQMFKEGREYTIILNVGNVVNGTNTLHIQWDFINKAQKYNTINSNVTNLMNSKVVYKFKQDEFPDAINRVYLSLNTGNPSNCTCEINDCIVLEGDHTQNPPSYFEGLMSVGQDVDKIEVLSNGDLYNIEVASVHKGTDKIQQHLKNYIYEDFFVYNPYTSKLSIVVFKNGSWVKDILVGKGCSKIVLNEGEYVNYINQYFANGWNENDKDKLANINMSFKQDKKQILFYNSNGELEPIQELHEWDSIEKHSDNKWYYHKRSGKVVLNGSENWGITSIDTNTIRFYTNLNNASTTNNVIIPAIMDKFTESTAISQDVEGFNLFGITNNTRIRISKTKLSSQDVTGFKQWLQANNVTVVYQLAQEEVYELAPLHLDSYANETLILCNSGAISPKMEFSITSHINELIKSQGDRISLLEEKMYKALKQVLAGDMYSLAQTLYPEDFVSKEEPIDVPTLLI